MRWSMSGGNGHDRQHTWAHARGGRFYCFKHFNIYRKRSVPPAGCTDQLWFCATFVSQMGDQKVHTGILTRLSYEMHILRRFCLLDTVVRSGESLCQQDTRMSHGTSPDLWEIWRLELCNCSWQNPLEIEIILKISKLKNLLLQTCWARRLGGPSKSFFGLEKKNWSFPQL